MNINYKFERQKPIFCHREVKTVKTRKKDVIWPTEKWEGSKCGRILPGIPWAWSQTWDTSPCPLIGRNSQWEAENPNFPLIDLQTSMRVQNGVEFYQECTGHVGFFLALLLAQIANGRLKILIFLICDLQTSVRNKLAKIANGRLKILIFLLFDQQTSVKHPNGVDFS